MFHNAVVGVDDGTRAQDAIALARLLLDRDGTVALAHVHAGDPRTLEVNPDYGAAERAESRALLQATRSEAGIDAELLSVGSLSVGHGLHKIVAHHGADLMVLGSHRHSMFGRVTLSDHLREALNGAACPVAVAPGGYAQRPGGLSTIGVGYDGSPESEHALRVGRRLASEAGAKLSAFRAVSLMFGDQGNTATVNRVVGDALERLAALGDVEPHATFGEAAEELALYGASVDLLIVGSRSYGPIGRLVHGSTSRRLAHIARGAVLVLTRSADRAGELAEVETH
ncbi:MAG: universal stress protein [Solirubrobacteraceae bacterium]